jgi:hypothetical protein
MIKSLQKYKIFFVYNIHNFLFTFGPTENLISFCATRRLCAWTIYIYIHLKGFLITRATLRAEHTWNINPADPWIIFI